MAVQIGLSAKDLQNQIERLNQTNEILHNQLIRAWRDVVNLQNTNARLFNENQELIQRLDACDSEHDLVAA